MHDYYMQNMNFSLNALKTTFLGISDDFEHFLIFAPLLFWDLDKFLIFKINLWS